MSDFQISEASKERGSFRCPIVVLDDCEKEELDVIVSRAAEGLDLNIMTRKGCTHDVTDLRRVAAGRAKCVIWLEPNGDEVMVILFDGERECLCRCLWLQEEQQPSLA